MTTATGSTGIEFARAHELPRLFPVLGRSTWNAVIASGEVRSRKIGRMRIVRVADVVAFLDGRGFGGLR